MNSSTSSSTSSIEEASQRRNYHFTPHKPSIEKELISKLNACELDSTGDSTYSLLSPIYHDSFESEEEEIETSNRQDDYTQNKEKVLRTKLPVVKPRQTKKKKLPVIEAKLTPWEEWLICKAKEERIQMENRALKEMEKQEEKLKEEQEAEKKNLLAEEKLRNWILKKNEKEKMEKESRLRKELEEKKAREEEKRQIEEKAKQKYLEWLEKKKAEECEKKRKEKEEKERQAAELTEKRKKAEESFQNWLQNAKTKPRPVLNSFGYANGKLTGYYDWSSYPAPSFCNPIPWKPIHVPPSEDASRKLSPKKRKRPVSSLLYRPSSAVICQPKDNLTIGTRRGHR